MFTYFSPLCFVLMITLAKEAVDDIVRHKRDKEINNKIHLKLCRNGQYKNIASSKIKVGDIIKVNHNERIPADMLLLCTTEKQGAIFIRTDQLDGETDWKLRKAINYTQNILNKEEILKENCYIVANPPNDQIYDFKGYFQNELDGQQEPLSLENALWQDTVLASNGYILGMVLYTGKETRAQMNSRESLTKVGKLDLELNRLSKFLFIFMVATSAAIVGLDGFRGNWIIKLFRFVLLLSYIIPISLRVNLDLAKIYYCFCIHKDNEINGTIPRNSTIPEELGRIQFLLTDKTGTLTKNDMTFKKVTMEYAQFEAENINDIRIMIEENCNLVEGPMHDFYQKKLNPANPVQRQKTNKRRDQQYVVRDLFTALALCHNVTPVYSDEANSIKEFQASSPDEVALVKFADQLGMQLIERDQNQIIIKNPINQIEEYEIMANFPFSSDTKRMGIVLKHKKTEKLLFYLKGAEVVMKNKVKPNQRICIDEACENLAIEGLRTLVISQKQLDKEQFQDWLKQYKQAQSELSNREEKVQACISQLEEEMELLGVTGVEDKLQDDVALTIENLRSAGIKVWMLTGDKVETATCIAVSAGFKNRNQKLFYLRDLVSQKQFELKLKEFESQTNALLLIDGTSLDTCFSNKKLEELFFNLATQTPSVCVCRCSPTQKSLITQKIIQYTNKRTACVGDGGNDVGMIQEASIGIGIVGKEGKQASLAADFSINQFSYIRKLILWHGRLSYKRSAILSQFVIHRGLIIAVIQAIFSIIFYFVAIPVYNGFLMLGYSTIYTSLPVLSLIFDEDVPVQAALKYPPLYKSLQKGRALSSKTFLIWIWKSIFQGCVIMFLTVTLFHESFTNIVTITFSSLIITELLNVWSEINKSNWKMIVASISTFLTYFISIAVLRSYFDVSYITWHFVLKIIAITLASWLPLFVIKWFWKKCFPTEEQKILQQEMRIISN